MPMQGSLSIEHMCRLSGVSRAGFYRSLQERMPVEEEMEVRSVIQQIAVEHRRRYGYRRIAAELRRRGMLVNHKRVVRIMREDNLLAVQPWWAGNWTEPWLQGWRLRRWRKRSRSASRLRGWCITPTVECSTPATNMGES